ncbi:hypothetical protein ACTXT7_016806, partial [Hymenolepis weldensis]
RSFVGQTTLKNRESKIVSDGESEKKKKKKRRSRVIYMTLITHKTNFSREGSQIKVKGTIIKEMSGVLKCYHRTT